VAYHFKQKRIAANEALDAAKQPTASTAETTATIAEGLAQIVR
jgi:hypothetical protein